MPSSLFEPLQRRCTVYIANREINPGCVGELNCCKAPLWGTCRRQVNNYSPEDMTQAPSKGHEASPQNRLGVGCKVYSSSKKLRGEGVWI